MEAAATHPNWDNHPLAWEYLLPGRCMSRRVDTLEIHSRRWGLKTMDLDVGFPKSCPDAEGADEHARCLVPVAYIPKRPVAPDLVILGADGNVVSFPTRRECMALTKRAIEQIGVEAPKLLLKPDSDYQLSGDLKIRIGEVVSSEPLRARAALLDIGEKVIPTGHTAMREWLFPLLQRLEDHYMLWAPIEGPRRGEQRLSIRRSDSQEPDSVLTVTRRPPEFFEIESEASRNLRGEWNPPRKWRRRPDFSALTRRTLVFFGLRPLKFEQEVLEADRFLSHHLRVVPPLGLIVRAVKVGTIDDSQWGQKKPRIEPLTSGIDRTIHGEGKRVGHTHLEMDPNPKRFTSQFTIGLRPGTTTLWTLVVVLTCALLWAMHNEVIRLLGLEAGAKEEEVEIQIAAAVLLVGPTFAAAWALRLRDSTLIKNMLVGTQILLMASAILSISTALVLAGVTPFGWEATKTIEWYASCCYVLAVLSVIGWLQAPSTIWLIYNRLLDRYWKNVLGTIILALLSWLALHKLTEWPGLLAAALLITGLSTALIAANRICIGLGETTRLATVVAMFGSLVTLLLAGRELEFFNRVADRATAHEYGVYLELAVAAAAFLLLCARGINSYRGGHSASSPEKPSNPQPQLPISNG